MFLSRLSLRNPVMITMLTLAIIIFGLVAVKTLSVELLPTMDFPVITVTTIYPGANARTIEEDIVKKLEDSIGTLNDIKHIDSTAIDNVGIIIVTFQDYVEGPIATQNVRDKVATVKSDLPDDADDSIIEQFDINAQAVMSLLLKAPSGIKLSEVTRLADKRIKTRLQSISGVGSVDIYGGREREIRVLLDPFKLNQLNLSPLDVVQLMKSKSVDIPAGSIKVLDNSLELSVRSIGEVETLPEINQMPLIAVGPNTLRLKDVARVEDGLEEEESASFLDLTPAVALKVKKQGSVNQVTMSEEIKAEIAKIEAQLPEGYSIEIIGDQAPFTRAAVESSVGDVFIGALMAMLIIYAFLMNTRAALIVAVSLPTSIIGTFLFVKVAGLSLNIMTTLALSISVGILTDDAIVVIEAIFRHIKKGKNKIRAVIDATNEVGLAVVSAELALICVFSPTAVMSGMAGTFFHDFGLTVVAAIIISMTVSFTVAPLLASRILKEEKKDLLFYRIMDRFLVWLENKYASGVSWALGHRAMVIVIAILLFVGGLQIAGLLPSAFFPNVDRGEFDVVVELDSESSIDRSQAVSSEIVEILSKYDWESFAFTTIGGGTRKEKHLARMRVMMKPKETRSINQEEAMTLVRERLAPVMKKYDAKVSISYVKAEGMETAPVQLNLVGTNFTDLKQASTQMIAFMEADGGFTDIIESDKGYKKEIRIQFNHDKMTDLGINPAQTGLAVRSLIDGEKISGINDETGEEIEIKAYLDDAYQQLDYLRSLPMRGTGGQMVRLADVAEITYGNKLVEINRIDRSRKIGVKSGLAPGYTIGFQAEKLENFAAQNFPPGVELKMAGDAEHMKESFTSLSLSLLAAIFLIYIVLSSQFNSFIHPFTIMTALPFAFTGAVASLYTFNQTLSVMSFIGIIMLMGIVTKNSILLVDYALQLTRGGMETVPALVESSRTRLRPILMTAGGTLVGMTPVVLSTANAAEIKHSMGFAIMGGLLFSTCITLFVVPVFFSLLQRFTRQPSPETLEELAKL